MIKDEIMSNTATVITTKAGEALIAQMQAENKVLVIDKFIFANVPNRPAFPNRDDVVPVEHTVHESAVHEQGRLTENSVIYSTTLASNVGPFSFNWSGLFCSEHNVLVAINFPPPVDKTVDAPGITGNTLVRSFVLEYKGISETTNITVDPSSWQYDAHKRMSKMDNDTAQAIIDQNGKDWFIDDGFIVTPQSGAYSIKAGAGYVSGHRISLDFDRIIQVPEKPAFIYVDAFREGSPTGEWQTKFTFVVAAEEKDDYTDAQGVNHFVCKIAQVFEDGSVADMRSVNKIKSMVSDAIVSNSLSKTILDFNELRNREPLHKREVVYVESHSKLVEGVGGGYFYYKHSDTKSDDDNGVVIVTTKGSRWLRCGVSDGHVQTGWFGVGVYDDDSISINAALIYGKGRKVISTDIKNRNIIVGDSAVVYSGTTFEPENKSQVWKFKEKSYYFDMICNFHRDKDSIVRDKNIKIGAFSLYGGLRENRIESIGYGELNPYDNYNGCAGVRLSNVDGYEIDGLEACYFSYGLEQKNCTNGVRKNMQLHHNADDGDSISDGDWVGSSDNIVTKDSVSEFNGFLYWNSGNSGFECDDGPDNVYYYRCISRFNSGRGFDVHIHSGINKRMVNIYYEECIAHENNRPHDFMSIRIHSTGFSIDYVDIESGVVEATYYKCKSTGHKYLAASFTPGRLSWELENVSSGRKVITRECVFDSSCADFSLDTMKPVISVSGVESYIDYASRLIGNNSNGNNVGVFGYLVLNSEFNGTEFFGCGKHIELTSMETPEQSDINIYSKLILNNIKTKSNVAYKGKVGDSADSCITLKNINSVEINGGEYNKERNQMRHWIEANSSGRVKKISISKNARFAINGNKNGTGTGRKHILACGGAEVIKVESSDLFFVGNNDDKLIDGYGVTKMIIINNHIMGSSGTVENPPQSIIDKDNF